MAAPLIIGDADRDALQALRELAEDHIVDVNVLALQLAHQEGKAAHRAQMTRQTIVVPLAFLVTFSIESGHPCGLARHISVSLLDSRLGERLPNPHAIMMIARELGFVSEMSDCATWIEHLDRPGGGAAINVVEPVTPATT